MIPKISILVDASQLNKEYQGTRTYIKELYSHLALQYPSIQVFMAMKPDSLVEKEFDGISNIRFIPLKRIDWAGRMLFDFPKIIKNGNFDFAHYQYTIPFIRSKKCKYIVTIHDILFNDFPDLFPTTYRIKRNFLFAYAARKSDLVLSVSNYSKEKIGKAYNINEDKVRVIPNGVNREFFEEHSKEFHQNYIHEHYGIKDYMLYVSRVEPRKNQLVVLNQFLKQEGIQNLVFIGKRSLDYAAFEDKMATLSNDENQHIHFFEQIPSSDLLHFHRAAQLFIYPSLAEGFGIPPLEAGASRIPVLCSNKTAMHDFSFFEDGFFNPERKSELEAKLRDIDSLTDPKRLELIKDKIEEKYDWQKSANEFYQLLSKHLLS